MQEKMVIFIDQDTLLDEEINEEDVSDEYEGV